MERHISTSNHFSEVLNKERLQAIVLQSLAELSAPDFTFDTFAFIGLSGATLAPILAYEMDKELLMIRKKGGKDGSASTRWVEGHLSAQRVVIVDDLVATGSTMSQVMHALRYIQVGYSPKIKVVGVLLHHCCNLSTGGYEARLYKMKDETRDARRVADELSIAEERFKHPLTDELVQYRDKPPLIER